MKKPSKKEMIYIGVVAVILFVLWFFARNGSSTVYNGAGQPADTGNLTFNIPPIGSDGMTMPDFGDVNLGGGQSGGCGCAGNNYYGSSAQLANALGDTNRAAVTDALNNAGANVNTMLVNNAQVTAADNSGPPQVISYLPITVA